MREAVVGEFKLTRNNYQHIQSNRAIGNYLESAPVPEPFPHRLLRQHSIDGTVALRVELALLVHVHYVQFDKTTRCIAPYSKVEPWPSTVVKTLHQSVHSEVCMYHCCRCANHLFPFSAGVPAQSGRVHRLNSMSATGSRNPTSAMNDTMIRATRHVNHWWIAMTHNQSEIAVHILSEPALVWLSFDTLSTRCRFPESNLEVNTMLENLNSFPFIGRKPWNSRFHDWKYTKASDKKYNVFQVKNIPWSSLVTVWSMEEVHSLGCWGWMSSNVLPSSFCRTLSSILADRERFDELIL